MISKVRKLSFYEFEEFEEFLNLITTTATATAGLLACQTSSFHLELQVKLVLLLPDEPRSVHELQRAAGLLPVVLVDLSEDMELRAQALNEIALELSVAEVVAQLFVKYT